MVEKLDLKQIKGLPRRARAQSIRGKIYVYYSYCYRISGKRKHERDYIGTVIDNEFRPNLYYLQNHPVYEKRPLDRWTDPEKRTAVESFQKEEEKLEKSRPDFDLDSKEDFSLCVGATALVTAILYKGFMVVDVSKVLKFNFKQIIGSLNLAIHAAITALPTYLAKSESDIEKFIANLMPSSQRASELLNDIGIMDLSKEISKLRIDRFGKKNQIYSLDGTCIPSYSKNISGVALGKQKDGTYGKQINISFLLNNELGEVLSYRQFAGNNSELTTLVDFQNIWTSCGFPAQQPILVMDRIYCAKEYMVTLSKDGYKFFIAAKVNLKFINEIIEDDNSSFYCASNYILGEQCYGVKAVKTISSKSGSISTYNYVFFDPNRQMDAIEDLKKDMGEFEKSWCLNEQKIMKENLANYYDEEELKKGNLVRKNKEIDYDCYCKGFFAFVSNINCGLKEALDLYRERNEVEVSFKVMFKYLLKTTRSHSTINFNGLLFITYIALYILMKLRKAMKNRVLRKKKSGVQSEDEYIEIGKLMSIGELLKRLQKIVLVKNGETYYLKNVTKDDRELVANLGFPGLFDSAEEVNKLLSARYLVDHVREATMFNP